MRFKVITSPKSISTRKSYRLDQFRFYLKTTIIPANAPFRFQNNTSYRLLEQDPKLGSGLLECLPVGKGQLYFKLLNFTG